MHLFLSLSLLESCEDELSTGLSRVVLKALTSDPLLLMLHEDERYIPCRSHKTNDRLMQSFSWAAINLHFLFGAKRNRLLVGDQVLLPPSACSQSAGTLDCTFVFFAISRLYTCMCMRREHTHTYSFPHFPCVAACLLS